MAGLFKSGWVRLWVVFSVVLLTGAGIISAEYGWGPAACYSFVSVTVSDGAPPKDQQLADQIRDEATTKTFCGDRNYSVLLTLEELAQRGVVTQVGFQWLGPRGWSFNNYDMLDILESREIRATEVIDRVETYVHEARRFELIRPIAAALLACLFSLAIGIGIAWVRKGFSKLSAYATFEVRSRFQRLIVRQQAPGQLALELVLEIFAQAHGHRRAVGHDLRTPHRLYTT